jgi:hypothetical protein
MFFHGDIDVFLQEKASLSAAKGRFYGTSADGISTGG